MYIFRVESHNEIMMNETTLKVMRILQVDRIEAIKIQELMAQEGQRSNIRTEDTLKASAHRAYNKLHRRAA
jgi:hypothetical protein